MVATVRERQYEPGFGWKRFKELIKDHFSSRRQRRTNSCNYNKRK